MTLPDDHSIRPLDDVVREHIETTVASYPDVPLYRLAVALGISPSTLYRFSKKAKSEETLVGDRR